MAHIIDLKKKNFHSDMAVDFIKGKSAKISKKKIINGIKVTDIVLRDNNSFYVNLEFDDITDYSNYINVKKVFISQMKRLFKKMKIDKKKTCLVIGLGNKDSTFDSLGVKIANNILVTRYIAKMGNLDENYMNISAITPGIEAQTGISSFEVIKSVVDTIKPDFVIVIDSLSTNSVDRINKNIQISNTGISPGSGVGDKFKEISFNTLNVPVLSIGVPTVISHNNLIITVREIDYLIEKLSMLISTSINSIISNFK